MIENNCREPPSSFFQSGTKYKTKAILLSSNSSSWQSNTSIIYKIFYWHIEEKGSSCRYWIITTKQRLKFNLSFSFINSEFQTLTFNLKILNLIFDQFRPKNTTCDLVTKSRVEIEQEYKLQVKIGKLWKITMIFFIFFEQGICKKVSTKSGQKC